MKHALTTNTRSRALLHMWLHGLSVMDASEDGLLNDQVTWASILCVG